MDDRTLHIYAQSVWHDNAEIIGTVDGLTRLRDAINEALASGVGVANVMASDGEGYYAAVKMVAESDFRGLASQYTDEVANGGGGDWPTAKFPEMVTAIKAARDKW